MNKRLLVLSFIEGATVMAVELCGARLLAPVFGSSLYVWASVLGITLIALATGYFSGGWWSEKTKSPEKKLFFVLSLASLSVLGMPFIAEYLLPRIAFAAFLPAMLGATAILLFAPLFLLGASSPLFIQLQSKNNADAGKISGVVYAISTFGGIVATFICGFYFLPTFGLKLTLLFFGSTLFIACLILLRTFSSVPTIVAFGLIYISLQSELKKKPALYVSEGIMGRVEVIDQNTNEKTIRLLKVNDIVQSEMYVDSKLSASEYVTVFDSLSKGFPEGSKALVLGLGAGLTSNVLVNKKFKVTAVEFDNRVIFSAKKYFGLNESVETIHDDARRFMNGVNEQFNIVLVDIFKAEEQPSHVLTIESLIKIKSNLNTQSKLIINWHGYSSGQIGKGTAILHQTLIESGFFVKYCTVSDDENHRNLMIVASLQPLPQLPFETIITLPPTKNLNTDDQPLLEEANALANMTWRKLYLKHYTGQ